MRRDNKRLNIEYNQKDKEHAEWVDSYLIKK